MPATVPLVVECQDARSSGELRNDNGASQMRFVDVAVLLVLATADAETLHIGLDQGNVVRETLAGASADVLVVFTHRSTHTQLDARAIA